MEFNDYENEKILAFEVGYSYRSPVFSANINAYYTKWGNKPLDSPPSVLIPPEDGGEPDPDGDRITVNIPGIDAIHQGIELDFALKPVKANYPCKVWFRLLIGYGILPEKEVFRLQIGTVMNYDYDAKGVHVGDAAQFQIGGSLRYEPIKNFYIMGKAYSFCEEFFKLQS